MTRLRIESNRMQVGRADKGGGVCGLGVLLL